MSSKRDVGSDDQGDITVKGESNNLAIWLTFFGKFAWPFVLLLTLGFYSSEMRGLFDRISKFNIAGQEFSFTDALSQPVLSLSGLTDITDTTVEIAKDTLELDAHFQMCKRYVVLRTDAIPDDIALKYKQKTNLIEVIRASIVCGEFVGLLVLDGKDKYIGAFDREFFLEVIIPWATLIRQEGIVEKDEQINWLESNTIFAFAFEYPEKRIESGEGFSHRVTLNESLSEALKKLLSSGKEFIGVVDSFGRFQGVVTRDILLNKLLLSLSSEQSFDSKPDQ